jgi:4-coumarate--CoA ligase
MFLFITMLISRNIYGARSGIFRLPDEEAGEIPAASVVLSKGGKESEEDVINYVASNVAHYKKVRVVDFVDAIPKSPSGKIMRRLIREKMIGKMRANLHG